MAETAENRLRRLHMRSIRRGIKEMDLILTHFSKTQLATLSADELDLYEEILSENDQDLYIWVTGQEAAPVHLQVLMSKISAAFEQQP